MGISDHGTTYMRVGGDNGYLRPWHDIYEGRRGSWGSPTMVLHIRIQQLTLSRGYSRGGTVNPEP